MKHEDETPQEQFDRLFGWPGILADLLLLVFGFINDLLSGFLPD